MTARQPRNHWVVCVDYAAGPHTAREAELVMARLAADPPDRFACRNEHALVIADSWNAVHRPQPSDELDDVEPFGVPDLEPHGCTGPGCQFCPGDQPSPTEKGNTP